MTSPSATLRQFKLPDVGEGLTEGEILQWLVAVGDTVTVNQPLCEVETAKAAVELPSPYAGTVVELLFEAGTMVDVGAADHHDRRLRRRRPAAGAAGRAVRGRRRGAAGRRPDRRPRAGRPHLGAGRLRPPEHRRQAPPAPRSTAAEPTTDRPTADGRRRPAGAGVAPLLPTAPDARTKPVRHGGLEVGRQAEAHALRGDAATAARGRPRPRPAPPAGQAAGAQVRQGPRRRPRPRSPAPVTAASSPAPTSTPPRPGTSRRGRSSAGRGRPDGPRVASSGSRSRACASTPRPRWWPAPSPPRTSRSS